MKNLKITYRNILSNSNLFGINTLGLMVAFAVLVVVALYVHFEFSYEKFLSNHERIFRASISAPGQTEQEQDTRLHPFYANLLDTEYPEIEAITKINSFKKAIVSIDQHVFYSMQVYSVDSLFYKVFDYPLLQGDKNTLFSQPSQVAITEHMAQKYFGTTDVLGRIIKITHQKTDQPVDFTIAGVLKDFPENTHFKAEMLCSFQELQDRNNWMYTYVLLRNKNKASVLQDSIQANWNKQFAEAEKIPQINLQPVADIHLYSHKSRELETNGNIKSIYLLLSGALIILIIALVNFVNLQTVQFIKKQRQLWVKKINGAGAIRLMFEDQMQNLLMLLLILSGASLLVHFFINYFHLSYLVRQSMPLLILITLGYILLVLLLGALPFFTFRKTLRQHQLVLKPQRVYPFFVVLQFALSLIAIASTMVLQKQMHFMSALQPGAEETNMLVISNNPREAVYNFETLKQRVLQHPEILGATAAMEEPAGNIMDRFQCSLDEQAFTDSQVMHVLCVDSNFFTFFNQKALAGTADFGFVPGVEWERKAIELWQLELTNQPIPPGLRDEISSYTDKYILNQAALKYLGIKTPEDAIGRKFRLEHSINYLFPQGEIIGVVPDFHYTNLYEPEKPLAMLVRKFFTHCFMFRFQPGQTQKAVHIIQEEWIKLFPAIPFQFDLMTDHYQKVYGNEYLQSQLIMLFAIISLVLSIMGILAMAGFMVERRTKEIGIRKVNGASVRSMVQMLNKNFITWVFWACIIGIPVAYWVMMQWLQNFAYKTPISWWIFALSAILILIIALISVSWQSFKAARRNPVEALRYE